MKNSQPVYAYFSVEAFQQGDNEAYKVIFKQWYQKLMHRAASIIKDEDAAQDIVAMAFERLFEHRMKIHSGEHIVKALFIYVRNLAIDHLRKNTQMQKYARKSLYSLEVIVHANAIEKMLEWENCKVRMVCHLQSAVMQLPLQRRKVIQQYFLQEMNTREIAASLQLKPQTVINHRNKAIGAIRRQIAINQFID